MNACYPDSGCYYKELLLHVYINFCQLFDRTNEAFDDEMLLRMGRRVEEDAIANWSKRDFPLILINFDSINFDDILSQHSYQRIHRHCSSCSHVMLQMSKRKVVHKKTPIIRITV